ncbi:hypothetical protein OQG94_18685, partial [Acinetobacter baumannii]
YRHRFGETRKRALLIKRLCSAAARGARGAMSARTVVLCVTLDDAIHRRYLFNKNLPLNFLGYFWPSAKKLQFFSRSYLFNN